jgi:hypothetical protein
MKPAKKRTKAAAIWKSGFRRTGNVIGNYLCADRFVLLTTGEAVKRISCCKLAGAGFVAKLGPCAWSRLSV